MKTTPTLGRRPLRFLLLDLPSDHEIEGALATECQVIYALLANQELDGVTKHIRIGRVETFRRMRLYPYDAEVVHVAGHATVGGLWMLGEVLSWTQVAQALSGAVTPLPEGQLRILHLSCCYSQRAASLMSGALAGRFSGTYCFREPQIPYSTAIAAWTMFFHQRPADDRHTEVVQRIAAFLGDEVLRYVPFRDQGMEQMARMAATTKPRRKGPRRTPLSPPADALREGTASEGHPDPSPFQPSQQATAPAPGKALIRQVQKTPFIHLNPP